MKCYACDAPVPSDAPEDNLCLCRSCWLKAVRPGRENWMDVLGAVYKFKHQDDPEVERLDHEDYRDLARLGLWPKFRADADLILDELERRSAWNEAYRSAFQQALLTPPDPVARDRRTTETAREISRRLAFDDEHPGIYQTGQERAEAYGVFFPPPLTREDVDEIFAERDREWGLRPVLLPFVPGADSLGVEQATG
jgi:hypothetical protein